jgi:hypothetical protein
MIQIAVAAGLAAAASASFAAPGADALEAQAHEAWKETITHIPAPALGCFHAVYPGTQWVRGQCFERSHRYLAPPPVKFDVTSGKWQVVGNGNDYAVKTPHNMSQVVGSFPRTIDVTYERGVGTDGGILGPNEYSLQVNSGRDLSSAACQGNARCEIWQQFVYSPDYEVQGTAAVFIEYWLIGWGPGSCPSGWGSYDFAGGSCVINSDYAAAPDEPITQLVNEKLSASAAPGGNDTAVFTDGSTATSISASDDVLGLGTAWNESEFNVVGNTGGSSADFNAGAEVTVKIAVTDGTTLAPTCLAGSGTTGETNNLTLGNICSANGGATPYIEFNETNTATLQQLVK